MDINEYIRTRNEVNIWIKYIKSQPKEMFGREIEGDMYGAQKRVWKMLRFAKRAENEFVLSKNITFEKWKSHFESLYSAKKTLLERKLLSRQNAMNDIEL